MPIENALPEIVLGSACASNVVVHTGGRGHSVTSFLSVHPVIEPVSESPLSSPSNRYVRALPLAHLPPEANVARQLWPIFLIRICLPSDVVHAPVRSSGLSPSGSGGCDRAL